MGCARVADLRTFWSGLLLFPTAVYAQNVLPFKGHRFAVQWVPLTLNHYCGPFRACDGGLFVWLAGAKMADTAL